MATDDVEPAATTTTPTTTPASRKYAMRRPDRVEKPHVGALLILLSILDLIVLGLAAYAMDKSIDGGIRTNGATFSLAMTSLIAAMVTVAAIISGWLHLKIYLAGSVSSAATIALLAWVLLFLAFGFACKQASIGNVGSTLQALEAFVVILGVFMTLYVFLLHMGLFNSRYGIGY